MIGIDLVDLSLAAAESNWKRSGYLDKVFNSGEQQYIAEAAAAEVMIWLLWTMKEAAYKIVSSQTGLRAYVPLAFDCNQVMLEPGGASGEVCYGDQTFITTSIITGSYVYTLARAAEEPFPQPPEVLLLPNSRRYREVFNDSNEEYYLYKKSSGLPELIHRQSGKIHAVSLSHHGKYLVIAYSNSPQSAG